MNTMQRREMRTEIERRVQTEEYALVLTKEQTTEERRALFMAACEKAQSSQKPQRAVIQKVKPMKKVLDLQPIDMTSDYLSMS